MTTSNIEAPRCDRMPTLDVERPSGSSLGLAVSLRYGSRPMIMAPEYDRHWLQRDRPQPMYDKQIHRLYRRVYGSENPGDRPQLLDEFKAGFLEWLAADRLNRLSGYGVADGYALDACIGCTHYIDDLYLTVGRERLAILAGDYKYHQRLNPDLRFATLETLRPGQELLVALPFPQTGDVHPQMDALLARCLDLGIPVHIDGAWLSCSRDIHFDFAHPAITSFAISLSKGLGLGGNRIALRFTRRRQVGPITIMNDFHMNCQSLLHLGLVFMRELGANYLWNKYGEAYARVCRDFALTPTKAVHLALDSEHPVGVRLLLRRLGDR